MSISDSALEQLLFENESPTLDFKRDQYAFKGASDSAKSELLKDILAFANAWRRSDAFILIGVEEIPDGRSIVVGISDHLDDADLQQFVNSKTQRPIHFSYYAAPFEGKSIGVIHLHAQDRPIYLKANFGKLQKDTVYVRRGSSTAVAAPDEIAKMGHSFSPDTSGTPALKVEFCDAEKFVSLGSSISVVTENILMPKPYEIPEYGRRQVESVRGYSMSFSDPMTNQEYWREAANVLDFSHRYSCLDFVVSNSGHCVALDARLEIEVDDPSENMLFAGTNSVPEKPTENVSFQKAQVVLSKNVSTVNHLDGKWLIEVPVGKIQPNSEARATGGLYVGAKNDCSVKLRTTLRADNLSVPAVGELGVEVKTKQSALSVADLMDIFKRQETDDIRAQLKKLGR